MIVAVEKKVPFWAEKGDRTLGRNGRSRFGKKWAIALWEEKVDRTWGRNGRSRFGKKWSIYLLIIIPR